VVREGLGPDHAYYF
jgi:hypothetical protein